jgi:hypothetical protein
MCMHGIESSTLSPTVKFVGTKIPPRILSQGPKNLKLEPRRALQGRGVAITTCLLLDSCASPYAKISRYMKITYRIQNLAHTISGRHHLS